MAVKLNMKLQQEDPENNFSEEKEDEETKQLIFKLQEEEKHEIEQRMQHKYDVEAVNFICQVCYEGFEEDNIFPLTSCEHVFHNECLGMFLHGEIKDSKFPLKCPDVQCKRELDLNDLHDLLSKEDRDKYYEFTYKQAVERD